MTVCNSSTNIKPLTIDDLPDAILSNICSSLSDTRSRNSLSLVSNKFLLLERTTRLSLTLRGNARDLFMLPNCFRSVTHLDLSLISPWGHSLLSSPPYDDPHLLGRRLSVAFPAVTSLVVYVRTPSTLLSLLPWWPRLRRVKLVRWHQRVPNFSVGADFFPLFEHCPLLDSLDLSTFYHWTEDLPPVLRACADVSARLVNLNLLTASFTEGFKSSQIIEITGACPNLRKFLVACTFDPRYIGFVGDETLLAIANNCPNLSLLHLADIASFSNQRGNPDNDQLAADDARISPVTLVEVFSALPFLEELVLGVGKNVRNGGVALEVINSKCKKLRVLRLDQFHGICPAVDWRRLDGVALCGDLESLSIKNSQDLTDMGLIAIGKGCCKLTKFEIEGCKQITGNGLRLMVSLRQKTLNDVKISCCKNLNTLASVQAVEPIREAIKRLHIDCVWNDETEECSDDEAMIKKKRCKYSMDCSGWDKLQYLSLWIHVGELLTPITMAGLDDCPNLEEVRIKVEGDCRGMQKPSDNEFGLSCLALYPKLSKMQLDCGETIGYALTAPPGEMDLILWERFFLNGIGDLSIEELDYWPPHDRDVNLRSLSLPAAGLLRECVTLRKLFIHGTAHEHSMMFLPKIPNLRDVQLREDYYPAPENDTSTEMRVGSCSRFEDALNSRPIVD